MGLTDDFKGALAQWTTGVAVVTVDEGGLRYGLTVSSFTSVSLDPPIILVCVDRRNRLSTMIERTGTFGVSVLAGSQEAASRWFSRPGRLPTEEFTEAPGEWWGPIPVLVGAVAHLRCELRRVIDEGDHAILLGDVREARSSEDQSPLVYARRGYRRLSDLSSPTKGNNAP